MLVVVRAVEVPFASAPAFALLDTHVHLLVRILVGIDAPADVQNGLFHVTITVRVAPFNELHLVAAGVEGVDIVLSKGLDARRACRRRAAAAARHLS